MTASNRISRRDFGRVGSTLAVAGLVPLASSASATTVSSHAVAQVEAAPAKLPKGLRLAFGWQAVAVGQTPVTLTFADVRAGRVATALRVSVAIGTRDARRVEVVAAGRVVGAFDVRFACPFQPYSVPLDAEAVAVARNQGLSLRLAKAGEPLWIWTAGRDMPEVLRPHLLLPGTAEPFAELPARLGSLASVQPFSWMEGCVLDGLLDLAATPGRENFKAVAAQHLDMFTPGDKLVYEAPSGVSSDGQVYGIEGTLPFAAMARLKPNHKLLDLPVQFWAAHQEADGSIFDGGTLTSEGSYTIGYPMAVIGQARKSDALERQALVQVRNRHKRLFDGKSFWRTRTPADKRGDRNWSRGVAWQLLGAARTLSALRNRADIKDSVADLKQLADWAMASQRPDGLWGVITDEPKLTTDTGGSAGLAAGLAIGKAAGFLGNAAGEAADRALEGLKRYLTPDGFLGGVSQANKGGIALQRGDYRVIYPMALGLMGQLIAARA